MKRLQATSLMLTWLQGECVRESDVEVVCHSTCSMIGTNIAQLAFLLGESTACGLDALIRFVLAAGREKTSKILFAGNFLRRNLIAAGAIAFSISYWSKGTMHALF